MHLLASAGDDTVKIWDPSQEHQAPVVAKRSQPVNTVRWNHTNAVVASAGEDGRLSLHHTTGALVGSIPDEHSSKGQLHAISSICFSKGSRYLVSGGASKEVHVWDLKRKVCVKSLVGHQHRITSVIYSHGDQHIASASLGGDVILHSQLSGVRVADMKAPGGKAVRALHFSPHQKQLLAGASDDGSVLIWDTAERPPSVVAPMSALHAAAATCVCFHPTSPASLASVGLDRRLILSDMQTRKPVATYEVDAPLTSLAMNSDGCTVAVGTATGRVLLFDTRRGAGAPPIGSLAAHGPQAVTCLQWQCGLGAASAVDPQTPGPSPAPGASTPYQRAAPSTPAAAATPAGTGGAEMGLFSPVVKVDPLTPAGQRRPSAEPPAAPAAAAAAAPAATTSTPAGRQFASSLSELQAALSTPGKEPAGGAGAARARDGAGGAGGGKAAADEHEDEGLFELSSFGRPKESGGGDGGGAGGGSSRAGPPSRAAAGARPGAAGPGHVKAAAAHHRSGSGAGSDWGGMSEAAAAKAVSAAVEEGLSTLRNAIHEDVQNLHLELLRQFHLQHVEFTGMVQGLSDAQRKLAAEVAALRREANGPGQ